MPVLDVVLTLAHGRDADALAAVASCFDRDAVRLVGAEPGTIAARGEAEELAEATFDAAVAAIERLDARGLDALGAVDTVAFAARDALEPEGGTPTDAFVAARETGDRLGAHGVPVYFFGEAASRPQRRALADVRRGGFAGLDARMPQDPPDRGPERPHPTAGAVAVGVR